MKVTKKDNAFQILTNYNGNNPYILNLKKEVLINKKYGLINDFNTEYILRNHMNDPKPINKIVKIADWLGEKKKEEWNTDFVPEKIKIISYLGDTDTTYHCLVQYRKSIPPRTMFLPKKGVINNFLVGDYHEVEVDFDRYDRLSSAKDPNRLIRDHQKEAVKFLLHRKKCILALGMGTGKTNALAVAAIEGNFDSIVVICPATLKTNWRNELLWYVNQKDITIIDSIKQKTKTELEEFLGYPFGKSNKNRRELLDEAETVGKWKDNRFVIINYEILDEFYNIPNGRSADAIKKAYENSPLLQYIKDKKSLIIIDEAHRLSNNSSTQYKIIKDMLNRANPDSLYLSTGTPITNNPQNLFCLLQLLKDPIADDWNYYMNRYCGATKFFAKGERDKWTNIFLNKVHKSNWYELTDDEKEELKDFLDKYGRKITVAKDATNLEELKERISHIYLRIMKEDLHQMVKKTIHEVYYTLSPEQKSTYDSLWDEYESAKMQENPDQELELNKELLEGGIYRRFLALEMVENTKKLSEKILSEDPTCKIVIFCCFDNEIYSLKEYFGDRCVIYNGKCSAKQKDAAVEQFQNNEDIKIFLGNIASAGVGITLTRANKLIFNDFDFVPSNNQQAEDRVVRLNQTRDCDIYYQIFSDTQYQHIWEIVMKKAYNIDQVIKSEKDK